MNIRSYSKPLNIPHRFLEDLWNGTVYAQEKVDGSQISFGIVEGVLEARSRKKPLHMHEDNTSMFKAGIQTILGLKDKLTPGYTYRGEYISKPKHNVLAYAAPPPGFIILYDVDKGNQDYMKGASLFDEARRLDLMCVPLLEVFRAKPTLETLDKLLDRESILGGAKIEGMVFKNYDQLDKVGDKIIMGKHVSAAFKEVHNKDWKDRNPSQGDMVIKLAEEYGTEARWQKAIQHMTESGKLEGVMQDMPVLVAELKRDFREECEEEVKEKLFKYFWPKLERSVVQGFPIYYKKQLQESFDE